MSPEQARGENLSVDQRSDLYSACVLFNELLSLQHYLHGQTTLEGVLTTISTKDVDVLAAPTHPAQGGIPTELLHILKRGLQRDPAHRYQKAGEFIHRLNMALDGTFPVQCPVTLTKRGMNGVARRLDRNPGLVLAAIGLSLIAIVTVTVVAVRSLV